MAKKRTVSNNFFYLVIGITVLLLMVFLAFFYKSDASLIIYKGTIPCVDCPGIEDTITLLSNHTYIDQYVYQERNTTNTTKGSWSIIKNDKFPNAIIYKLLSEDGQTTSYYILEENKIRPLDSEFNELPPPYNAVLVKQ